MDTDDPILDVVGSALGVADWSAPDVCNWDARHYFMRRNVRADTLGRLWPDPAELEPILPLTMLRDKRTRSGRGQGHVSALVYSQ